MKLLKLTLISTALFSTAALAQSQQSVNVYSYDSFTSEWGAGPKVKQDFEKTHPQCTINFTPFESVGCCSTVFAWKERKQKRILC